MRYLQGQEILEADIYFKECEQEARKSRCQKSQRGVVIVNDGIILGRASNNPPLELLCEPEKCHDICNEYCIHAEDRAIHEANAQGLDLKGSRLYHLKIKEGAVRSSRNPSCPNCSKWILESGIAEVVLKHEIRHSLYDAKEFHELSLEAARQAKKEIKLNKSKLR